MPKKEISIVLVDDEAGIRMPFTTMLERNGYKVIPAENGEDGLVKIVDQYHEKTPPLILTDVRMPGSIDGVKMIQLLEKNYRSSDPLFKNRVIFMSADPGGYTLEELGELSAHPLLSKPVRLADLLQGIDLALASLVVAEHPSAIPA